MRKNATKLPIRRAVKDYNNGASYVELAKKYGYTHQRINQLIGSLVNKRRRARGICRYCERCFFKPVKRNKIQYCSNWCRKEALEKQRHSACPSCKGEMSRTSKVCRNCTRKHNPIEAAFLYRKGIGTPQIGEVLGTSHVSIYKSLRQQRVKMQGSGRRRSLSNKDVRTLLSDFRKANRL